MTISFAQHVTLRCRECGTSYHADVWLIIAADERPDLLERVRIGTLHTLTCPNGHENSFDAPLLIYRPHGDPPLLFSATTQTTSEQNRELVAGLISTLRAQLGVAWRDELAQGISEIPRRRLPQAIKEDSEDMHRIHESELLADRLLTSSFTARLMEAQRAEGRFLKTSDLESLDVAVEAWIAILTHPDFATAPIDIRIATLNDAGIAFLRRYWGKGHVKDLVRALELWTEARQNIPTDSPHLPSLLTNLGTGLSDRYAHIGQLEDLEQAIRNFEQAVQLAPVDAPTLPGYLNNLATGLKSRHTRMGRLGDLEQAIRYWRQAVQSTAPSSPDLPGYLNNLGNGLRSLYVHTQTLEDLDKTLSVYHQAVATTPPNSPDLPGYLNNLGIGLSTRYERTKELRDLDQAIRVYQQAVQRSPSDSPDQPARLNNLANALRDRYTRSGQLEDLEQAQQYYEAACERGQVLAPEVALAASQNWGRWACERAAWAEAVRAFETGIVTVEQLHRSQLRRGDQETWLSAARGLHTHAVYALIRAGDPTRRCPVEIADMRRRAVEVAEIGRARGLGETLARDRSDLSSIAHDHPETYERYRTAAARVRQFEHVGRETARHIEQFPSDAPGQHLATLVLAARSQLDAAIEAIRTIPGYERFLRPPSYTEIAAAALPGMPLVYLITTPAGSLALIGSIGSAEPEALLLDDFKEADLDALLIKRENGEVVGGYLPGQFTGGAALTAALAEGLPRLGTALIGPLAAHLRQHHASGVTLIPTGLLSLLPFHAATYAVEGQTRCLLDELDVAYAPSARVLSTAQRELRARANGALRLAGVGNPTSDLRFAGPELQSVAMLFPTDATTAFYRADATREAILRALPGSSIGHFSCHGNFAADPLDSALLLAQQTQLTLREFVTGDASAFATLRLAVLSACQTAITDFQRLPDESIGLPGGFLQAGVPAVVGTLWSVNDLSTAMLMFRFYELHMQGDAAAGLAPQSPARALRLAQRWLRDLTNQALYAYYEQHRQMEDAMRLAIRELVKGRPLDVRPYADPIYWAAFTFNGTAEV